MPEPSRLALTVGDLTRPCADAAKQLLQAAGFAVDEFPANGPGGRAFEAAVAAGRFLGVLDLTTKELADHLVGGLASAGPDRLTAASAASVPQVVVPGELDAADVSPDQFHDRLRHALDQRSTRLRTTAEENDQLGRELALKASAARGPVVLLLPLRGLSSLDHPGEPFWLPDADAALFQSVRNWLSPDVRLVELDLHINDPAFAQAAADALLRLVGR